MAVVDEIISIASLLKGTQYALSIFKRREVAELKFFEKNGKPYLKSEVDGKDRPAKPEEIVRQLFLRRLLKEYGYPKERIALEKPVYFGSAVHEKAADIVIWDKDDPTVPYIIVE